MDTQHDPNNPSVSLFSDPFSSSSFALPSTTAQLNITPISTNPPLLSSSTAVQQLSFTLVSPSPSTPARLPFNPDDFLISPPPQLTNLERPIIQRATPELSRRLFAQCDTPGDDPNTGLSATPRVPSPKTSRFLNAPDDENLPSPMISLSFSSPRHFLPAAIPPTVSPPDCDLSHALTSEEALGGSTIAENGVNANNNSTLPNSSPFLRLGDELLTPESDNVTQKPLALPADTSTENGKRLGKTRKKLKLSTPSRKFQQSGRISGMLVLPSSHPSGITLPTTPFTPAMSAKCKCSCKASRCLKLYCLCFANSGFCSPECSCRNCLNTNNTEKSVRDAREAVLLRDPRAFDPKLKQPSPTSVGPVRRADIHFKGCNCRKGCSKRYCVCRELQVECGPRCTCSGPKGCMNRKPSSGKGSAKKGFTSRRKVPLLIAPSDNKSSSEMVKDDNQALQYLKESVSQALMNSAEREFNGSSSSAASAGATLNASEENGFAEASHSKDMMDCGDVSLEKALMEKRENENDGSNIELERNVLKPHVEKGSEADSKYSIIRPQSDIILDKCNENVPTGDGDENAGEDLDVLSADGKTKDRESPEGNGMLSTGADSLFGQELDEVDLCRLPRILRVKMGSGRRLNKFSL